MSTTPPPDYSSQESLNSGPIERIRRVPIGIYPENCIEKDDAKSEQDSTQTGDCISPENAVQSSTNFSLQQNKSNDQIEERDGEATQPPLLQNHLPGTRLAETETKLAVKGDISIDIPDGSDEIRDREDNVQSKREIIVNTFYTEVSDFIIKDEEEYTISCCENFTDTCCQSVTCCCPLCDSKAELKMTDTLRRAKSMGLKVFRNIAFPFFGDLLRDIWVSLELITAVIGFALSLASFLTLENRGSHNVVHFSLACISIVLAVVDSTCVLKGCRSCRSTTCGKRKVENASKLRSGFDVVRLILTELLIYPILICDVFSVVTGRGYEGETHLDRFGFTLFIVSCMSMLLYNYAIRIIALIGLVKGVIMASYSEEGRSNLSLRGSAFMYIVYFAVHAFLQMLVQVLMIVAIGGKIRYDNHHFYGSSSIVLLYYNHEISLEAAMCVY